MSIILGVEKIPYCCAAKSYTNDRGAITRAVECVTPMLSRLCSCELLFSEVLWKFARRETWESRIPLILCYAEVMLLRDVRIFVRVEMS